MTRAIVVVVVVIVGLAAGGACPGAGPEAKDASDPPCAVCREEKCGALAALCVSSGKACACMSDCLGEDGVGGVDACLGTCDLTERPARFVDLEVCVAAACPDSEDECSTPDDWVAPDGTVLTTDAPIGGGADANCAIDRALPFTRDGSVMQLESSDGTVCARVVRVDDGPGVLANTSWRVVDVRVGPLGGVAHVDDPAALCWYSSHHNFQDWLHVWTGTRHHDLKLEQIGHDGSTTYALHTFEQGPVDVDDCGPVAQGAGPVGEPLRLFPVNP